jgi:magnesium-transporting ATPase (P-type)
MRRLNAARTRSPLTKEIKAFVLLMGGVAFLFAVILFGIGMARGNTFITSLSIGIGIFVAFALCGMPATVSWPACSVLVMRFSAGMCDPVGAFRYTTHAVFMINL